TGGAYRGARTTGTEGMRQAPLSYRSLMELMADREQQPRQDEARREMAWRLEGRSGHLRPRVVDGRQPRCDLGRARDAVDVGDARRCGLSTEARRARLFADVPDQVIGQEAHARPPWRRRVRYAVGLHAVEADAVDATGGRERVRDPSAVGGRTGPDPRERCHRGDAGRRVPAFDGVRTCA